MRNYSIAIATLPEADVFITTPIGMAEVGMIAEIDGVFFPISYVMTYPDDEVDAFVRDFLPESTEYKLYRLIYENKEDCVNEQDTVEESGF